MQSDSPIRTVLEGVNVQPLAWALKANAFLWNQNTARTSDPVSPHHGLDDIWARYASAEDDPRAAHDAVWYSHVTDVLPVKCIVYDLAHMLRADRIGGVLITRIPPGSVCKPHVDTGWHSTFYRKFGVQIASSPGQSFCFDGVQFESRPGEVFEFDNSRMHWVTNGSDEPRVTMIVCLRLDTIEGVSPCPGV